MKFKGKIAAWFWIIFLAGNVLMAYELVESSGVSAEIGAALVVFNAIFIPMVVRNYVVIDGTRMAVYFGIMKAMNFPVNQNYQPFLHYENSNHRLFRIFRISHVAQL